MPSVADLEARGREHPHQCARCGKPSDMHLKLLLTDNEDPRVVRRQAQLPVCLGCALDLLAMPTTRVVG